MDGGGAQGTERGGAGQDRDKVSERDEDERKGVTEAGTASTDRIKVEHGTLVRNRKTKRRGKKNSDGRTASSTTIQGNKLVFEADSV